MFLFLILAIPASIFAQGTAAPIDFNAWMATLASVASATVFVAAFIITLLKVEKGAIKQIIALLVAVTLTFLGNVLNIGFTADFPWLTTLAYGFGAGLVANGFADAGFVQSILTALNLKKEKK